MWTDNASGIDLLFSMIYTISLDLISKAFMRSIIKQTKHKKYKKTRFSTYQYETQNRHSDLKYRDCDGFISYQVSKLMSRNQTCITRLFVVKYYS